MKRKLISLMLCGILSFTLVSCGNDDNKDTNKDSSNATTTESDKTEYRTLTTDEAIEFNSTKVYEFEDYFKENGIDAIIEEFKDDIVDVPVSSAYVGSGEFNEYQYIGYSSEIKEGKVIVRYEFAYYADRKGIQAGTVDIPKSRDLLIAEPYKIMTGDEISEELLDKIDEVIEEGFIDDDQDETTVEINGPFKVNVRVDGIDLTFQIISDGDGKGN